MVVGLVLKSFQINMSAIAISQFTVTASDINAVQNFYELCQTNYNVQ